MNHTQLKLTPQRDSHTSRLTNYFSSVPEKNSLPEVAVGLQWLTTISSSPFNIYFSCI